LQKDDMKIEFIDGAGKRLTDGSSIALGALTVIPTFIAMLPDSGPVSTKDLLLIGFAVIGWLFKFIRVVP
jgi:hypothetical protein